MPIVESSVSRELEIRFLDAKAIVTDAKLNLGIAGYPSERQALHIQREAVRIFANEKSETERLHMRLLHHKLNRVKSAIVVADGDGDSSSFRGGGDEYSVGDRTSYSSSTNSTTSASRRRRTVLSKLKGWGR